MSGVSDLYVPEELKERIERVAREREQNPSMLIATALDLLLETEALQADEARRRLSSPGENTISNARVMSWLDSWGLGSETPPPKCE